MILAHSGMRSQPLLHLRQECNDVGAFRVVHCLAAGARGLTIEPESTPM
jgi:hypothetical protein